MSNLILRLVVNGVALAVTAAILPGIEIANNEVGTYVILAIIFGLVNAFLKPIIVVLSCPLVILSLGLFMLVINGVMLLITDAIAGDRFTVDGFGWAILGGLIMGIVGGILEGALGLNDDDDDKKKDDVVIIRS